MSNEKQLYTSSAAKASMYLGIAAFLISWIPFIGTFSIPISGLGLIMAIIGIITISFGKAKGLGFAISGLLVCGIALAIAWTMTFAISTAVNELSDLSDLDSSTQLSKIDNYSNGWNYSSSLDDVSGEKTYTATIASNNKVNFAFPYNGLQRAYLKLRTHPRWGKSLILKLNKAQFLCNSYDGCSVQIRFDSSKPINFSASAPEDLSTNVIFINNYSEFASNMLKAKKAYIAATFYQEGEQVFEFDVDGFSVETYRSKDN